MPEAKLPIDSKPTLEMLADYPDMTGWFSPGLLMRLLWRVIVSDLFGQYADRRLLEAALDTVSKEEIQKRDDLTAKLEKDQSGAVWVDFVADLGDGFDATYAIAYLLAQEKMTVDNTVLPRGGALFMGGDEVYPTSNRDDYNIKLRAPYFFAFPDQKLKKHPPLFAIPGNHDWYDGLVTFLAFFAREKPTKIGNWRTQQQRSYFAAKLSETCWLWAIDIALVSDMDQPQADYFVAIARAMPQGASIILCSAEPGWYKVDSGSYRSLSYAGWIAENAGKDLHIPLVLSGDTHHYARYTSEHGTQYITSGGGGAFLHGTHQLPNEITADWIRHSEDKLSLRACYPDKKTSRQLLKGDLRFPVLNFGFSAALGVLYSAIAYVLSLVPRLDLAIIMFLLFASGFFAYSAYQESASSKWKLLLLSLMHSVVHFGALLLLLYAISAFDARLWNLRYGGPWWLWLAELAIPLVIIGGLVAGLIFGLNLFITCMWFDMNHNDAFSAMRLNSHRHFLRLRIVGDEITVYPIGVDRVPARQEWRDNPKASDASGPSYFLPPEDFRPRMIEDPIVISGYATAQTLTVKRPEEMPRP